jgi:hypothetical protein
MEYTMNLNNDKNSFTATIQPASDKLELPPGFII